MDAEVDLLFQQPLSKFIASRNALAARLKGAGSADADLVRTLPKPSMAAWTVNQLYWRQRQVFDRLLAAGARFRASQAAQLAGKAADLRGPIEERREALATLVRLAVSMLRDAGHPATPDLTRRVTRTLEALAALAGTPQAPPAGRLTAEVPPPGFDAIAALVPAAGKPVSTAGPPRVLAFRRGPRKRRTAVEPAVEARRQEAARREALAAAKKAVRAAERMLRKARAGAERAEAALKQAAARAKMAERARLRLEPRFARLAAAADQARQAARQIASQAEDAAQAVDDAELALARAKRALAEAEGGG